MGTGGLITNKHLAKLWDFMASYNCKSQEQPSDILKAFQECDEALSELDGQCEHWKIMYANACGDQDVFKESIRLQDIAYRKLEQKIRDQEKEIIQRRKEADGLYKALDLLRDEKGSLSYQKIRDQEKKIGLLKMENKNLTDILREKIKTIGQLREENDELNHKLQDLKKKCDELNKDRAYMTNSRNAWKIRAEHAEAEVEELANKRDQLQEENEDLKKKLTEANDILEETNRDRNEWRRQALMTKLTSKVPDIKEEYTMTFTMDKADYKDLMKLLLNKSFGASPEYMRDSLKEFCDGRYFCQGCPLRFSDCNFDDMSDEDIEKHYKMVIWDKAFGEDDVEPEE